MKRTILIICNIILPFTIWSQQNEKFEQLKENWSTPNEYHTASGAPGSLYWQQQADYNIKVILNDQDQSITGEATITYTNNSPHSLAYIWMQLDQNLNNRNGESCLSQERNITDSMTTFQFYNVVGDKDYKSGYTIKSIKDQQGHKLPSFEDHTVMRIDLPKPLKAGEQYQFSIEWQYQIQNRFKIGGRSGFEYFPKDDNRLYNIAQFFPRMCVYDAMTGWQTKQYLGSGEFALEYGDYDVSITVPSHFVIAATGLLNNPQEVLTEMQQKRFEEAKSSSKKVIIITEEEAIKNEKSKSKTTKTWRFKANKVRDFSFAASPKFIWEVQKVSLANNHTPLAMSFYPKEGNPLWGDHALNAVIQALQEYSRMTFPYPYPQATIVNAANVGMEYPMLGYAFGRPIPNEDYTDLRKFKTIAVIIHEVGHNFFPMIVNSDERQWKWMDEGLNSFLGYLTEVQSFEDFPHRRGPAATIIPYLKSEGHNQIIMTSSDVVELHHKVNYDKVTFALNYLRNEILGKERFDFAFQTYCNRWEFKRPQPEDFFRSMEDASGMDLDWYWKAWFYTTDHVDVAVKEVKSFSLSKKEGTEFFEIIDPKTMDDSKYNKSIDFYDEVNLEELKKTYIDKHFCEVTFQNKGGIPVPLNLKIQLKNNTSLDLILPATIWRKHNKEVSQVFVLDAEIKSIVFDPKNNTSDTDVSNNSWTK
ncbi:MAG: M1 family metallopeptidase [Flavobacteriales bacterium]|nr:M1 family metallopeptidase [Flavobacteriales bacterium]